MRTLLLVCFILFFSHTLFAGREKESFMCPWGFDADLVHPKNQSTKKETYSTASKICQSMVIFFQKHISPIDGPRSHFYPTSSQYTLEALQKHGIFKGIALGCDRLMRENGEAWVYPLQEKKGIVRKIDPIQPR